MGLRIKNIANNEKHFYVLSHHRSMGILPLLLAIIVFTLIGCMFGIVTGLVPGIHVNKVACIFKYFWVI
jgi:hypothetical protein